MSVSKGTVSVSWALMTIILVAKVYGRRVRVSKDEMIFLNLYVFDMWAI
jgi:hypothetical protein